MASKGVGGHQRPYRGRTDEWLTPPGILAALGPFDLDPCACPEGRPWPTAALHWTKAEDGLAREWRGRVWLNPPYGPETGRWVRRLADHGDGVALVFARTETEAFHRWCWERASAMLFLRGRLHFCWPDGQRAKFNAGAPSVLVAYGPLNAGRLRDCGLAGRYVPLGADAPPPLARSTRVKAAAAAS